MQAGARDRRQNIDESCWRILTAAATRVEKRRPFFRLPLQGAQRPIRLHQLKQFLKRAAELFYLDFVWHVATLLRSQFGGRVIICGIPQEPTVIIFGRRRGI